MMCNNFNHSAVKFSVLIGQRSSYTVRVCVCVPVGSWCSGRSAGCACPVTGYTPSVPVGGSHTDAVT